LADSILLALDNVTNGLVIYPNVIKARIAQELPFSMFHVDVELKAVLALTSQQWQLSRS